MNELTVARPVLDPATPPASPRPRPAVAFSVALVAAVLAPIVTFGISVWLSWDAAWTSAAAEVTRTADAAAEYGRRLLEAQVLRIDRANDVLAGLSDAEIRLREPELHAALRAAAAEREPAEREAFYVFVYDRDGAPLVSSNLLPVPPPSPLLVRREFNQALRGPDAPWVHVGQVLTGSTTGRPFLAISARRSRTGNPPTPGGYDGVVNASVYLDHVNPALAALGTAPGDVVTLVRTDGALLARSVGFGARPPDGARISSGSPMMAVMARGEARATIRAVSSVDGVERVAAYRRVGGDWPIYAFAGRDRAVIAAAWSRSLVPQAALAAGSSALLLLLALAVARRQRALARANADLERRVA
ncbi:hypothetical protein, partial [Falsiroseomonas oryzae]